MYTIAICDPSKSDADSLRHSIHNVLDRLKIAHIIYYYKDSANLFHVFKKYPEKFNFLFLETQMTPMNGIELARKLRQERFEGHIAYITETDSYVFDGYNVGACQYFIKPLDEKRLHELFFRLTIQNFQHHTSQYLKLNYGTVYHKIRYSDITYIETSDRKVAIHTKQQTYYYPCKLSEMEKLLPPELFVRCHQSFILSIQNVKYLIKSVAVLLDNTEIPVSRSYKKDVQNIFHHES